MRAKDHSFGHQDSASLNQRESLNPAPWEREALLQRQEHTYRQKQSGSNGQAHSSLRSSNPQRKSSKSPPQTFERQLAEAFLWLEKHFPQHFGEDRVAKPLNLSLLHELKLFYSKGQGLFPPNLPLRAALKRYCASDEYLETLVSGAIRYDLQGNPCGVVTEGEARIARERLAKPFKERFS